MKKKPRERKALKIHTIKHLQYQLGLSPEILVKIANNITEYYDRYENEKSGKRRIFYNPKFDLREIQNCIRRLLEHLSLPAYLKGGIKGQSAFTNAQSHVGARHFLNLDISDFYPSINQVRVYKLFIRLKCQPDVARLLTRLTTADYHLPTGFITSPIIANLIILHSSGPRLDSLCQKHKAMYTQFYDDMTISGGKVVPRLPEKARTIIEQNGFRVHPNKGGLFTRKNRPNITGFRVGSRITIDREYRKDLRKILCDCRRIGPGKYINAKATTETVTRYSTVDALRQHLYGRLNYLRYDPIQFKRFKVLFDQIDWKNQSNPMLF